jgi:hypothetical protein
MEANLGVWNSHIWNDRQLEIEPGHPLIQHSCRPCGRNFVEERMADIRYAVHVGVARFDRLSDETTEHWLTEVCPSEYLVSDDADRKTRFSTLAIKVLLPIDLASPILRVPHRPLRVAQRKVATKLAIAV